MEKIYKTMRNTGAASIAVGIIVASVGLAAGIIAIVNGALLLKRKSDKIVLNVDKVAKEVGSARVANIVLLGATIPFLGIDYEKVQDSIREIFLRKGEAIVEMNLKALAAGKEIAEKLMQ